MAAADTLQRIIDQATARLEELDADPDAPAMNYTVGDQTYDYATYRASLMQEIKDAGDALAAVKKVAIGGKPFVVRTRFRG